MATPSITFADAMRRNAAVRGGARPTIAKVMKRAPTQATVQANGRKAERASRREAKPTDDRTPKVTFANAMHRNEAVRKGARPQVANVKHRQESAGIQAAHERQAARDKHHEDNPASGHTPGITFADAQRRNEAMRNGARPEVASVTHRKESAQTQAAHERKAARAAKREAHDPATDNQAKAAQAQRPSAERDSPVGEKTDEKKAKVSTAQTSDPKEPIAKDPPHAATTAPPESPATTWHPPDSGLTETLTSNAMDKLNTSFSNFV